MRIAVSGSTGLVGEALLARLTDAGHDVVRLVRRDGDGQGRCLWDPDTGAVDADALGRVDAVVHLAGENIAAGRWTDERKRRIAQSRGPATERLCRTLASLPEPPRVLIAASATGVYGDRGDDVLTEGSAPGPAGDFLVGVARDWEAATSPLGEAGARVVNLRIGVVLARRGGALQRMLTPFRLGVGGRLGDGRQWLSWISLTDLVRAIEHALLDDELRGPVLAVAPRPVTNREFTKTLGRVLRRPTLLPVPRFALRLLFGEMSELLFGSQRCEPRALLKAGFTFEHATLETALRAELDPDAAGP